VIQAESEAGEETFEADIVFDATGGYTIPNPLGAGGLPARGERKAGDAIVRDHTSLAERLPELRGKSLLLVGHGHSAANALLMLEDRGVDVIWAVRTPNRRPCEEVANDPLLERLRVVERANALAADPPAWLRVERRASVRALSDAGKRIAVSLGNRRSVEVDAIASFTGFRPDLSHIGELQLELSPVTEGGSRLYRAISNVTDCLAVPRVRPEDLETGEPGFYFIGARSYGRARTFLLQTGLEHIRTILAKIAGPAPGP
jgi:thioredoxin reductase